MGDNISAGAPKDLPGPFSVSGLLGPLLSGFIAGVALQLQQPSLFALGVYAALMLGSACLLALVWRTKRGRVLPPVLVVLLMSAAFGFGLTGLRALAFQQTALSPTLEGKDILVTGQVLAMPQFGDDGLRFRFGVDAARLNGQAVPLPPQIYLGWYSGFGARPVKNPVNTLPVKPVDNDSTEPAEFSPELQRQPQILRAGERWQMTVRLKAPHGNSNPLGLTMSSGSGSRACRPPVMYAPACMMQHLNNRATAGRIRWSVPASRCAKRSSGAWPTGNWPGCWRRWWLATRMRLSGRTGMCFVPPALRI